MPRRQSGSFGSVSTTFSAECRVLSAECSLACQVGFAIAPGRGGAVRRGIMLSKVTENTTAPDREEASMAQTIPLPPLVRGQWTKMTYEDFLAWAPEGLRTEWRDGEGIVYVSA